MKVRRVCRVLLGLTIAMGFSSRLSPESRVPDGVVYRVATEEKVVALTFDDGPHPIFTPELLRVLAKHNVKATFFMIGRRMEAYPKTVEAVVKAGHVIANHTYDHPKNIELEPKHELVRELDMCERVIERFTGKRAWLFRPPKGLVDGRVLTIVSEAGYTTVLWTVCADHHDAPTPQLMARRVTDHVRPGAIILAHDGRFPTRWKDVTAARLIIDSLRTQGYRFVTVPELLELGRREKARLGGDHSTRTGNRVRGLS